MSMIMEEDSEEERHFYLLWLKTGEYVLGWNFQDETDFEWEDERTLFDPVLLDARHTGRSEIGRWQPFLNKTFDHQGKKLQYREVPEDTIVYWFVEESIDPIVLERYKYFIKDDKFSDK